MPSSRLEDEDLVEVMDCGWSWRWRSTTIPGGWVAGWKKILLLVEIEVKVGGELANTAKNQDIVTTI